MSELQMLTLEEVSKLLNVHRDTTKMLMEVGIINSIKTGKCYMFSQEVIKRFQREYEGYDVSNMVKAIAAYKEVEMKKADLAESASND